MKLATHEKRKSFKKFAITGQHNGSGTLKQRKRSAKDKLKHQLKSRQMFAMRGQTGFTLQPWSIISVPGGPMTVLALETASGEAQYRELESGRDRACESYAAVARQVGTQAGDSEPPRRSNFGRRQSNACGWKLTPKQPKG